MKNLRLVLVSFFIIMALLPFQNCAPSNSFNAEELQFQEQESLAVVSCEFNGQAVAPGVGVVAYQASTVPFDSVCISQARVCSKTGVLGGSYLYASCTPGAPAACLFNGVTVPSGDSVSAYFKSSVAAGQTCTSQSRVCTNGSLSGTYTFSSCAVVPIVTTTTVATTTTVVSPTTTVPGTPTTTMPISGVAWYVEKGATGSNNGTSWSNAWNDTTAINWTSVKAGDVIYLSGGSGGKTYSPFTTAASGTSVAGKRIYIRRSIESGRDGIVTLNAPIQVPSSYITIDGMGWNKIIFNMVDLPKASVPGNGGGGALWITGDNFEIKFVRFVGNFSAGDARHTLAGSKSLNTLLIHYCDFYKTAGEDHINWQGNKLITVDHSVFTTPSPPNDGSHRDLMNPWTGPGGYDLYFTNNIVYGLATNGFAMLFQETSKVGNIHISHNVFANSPYVVQFGSGNGGATSFEMHNNVYYKTTDENGSGPAATHKNEIFVGPAMVGGSVHNAGGSVSNSISYNAGSSLSGSGNLNGVNPQFIDVNSPLGVDGVPFTADDGFNIKLGSPAIDAGTTTGLSLSFDITGKAYTGTPDIGPYEYRP